MTDTLVIPFWQGCPAPDQRLLSVTFKDRIVLQARRAGFQNFLLCTGADGLDQIPAEFVILLPNLLLSGAAWEQLKGLAAPWNSLTLARETDSVGKVRCKDVTFLLNALKASRSYGDLLANLSARLDRELVAVGSREWVPFRSKADQARVENWMLQRLIKESESFMSRHVERKISLAVTRILIHTPITPNAMTLVSLGIGFGGAILFALPRSYHLTGSVLFWLHSVLDGCDGELARLKFAESRWGGLLDFWGDNAVHSAVFSAIAVGMSSKGPGRTPFIFAACAVAGTLCSAVWVYWTTMRRRNSDGPLFTSVLAEAQSHDRALAVSERIVDQLARRDFLYLVIVLAMMRKLEWFLWMAAVGAPLYFFALTGFSLKNCLIARRQLARPRISERANSDRLADNFERNG